MDKSISFSSYNYYGPLNLKSNQLSLTSIKPDNCDTSDFVLKSNPFKPDCEPQKQVDTFTSLMGTIKVITYAKAIMPDWVDVTNGSSTENLWITTPTIDEAKVVFTTTACLNLSSNKWADVILPTKFIGKNKKTVIPSCEVFVEYCNNSHCGMSKEKTIELTPISMNVVSEVDYSLDTYLGNVTGSGNLKNIQIISNKNSFLDIYFDMEGILEIENLPLGLSYSNKHIKGVPIKSGTYLSIIKLDPNIGGNSEYKLKIEIPKLERII